MLIGGCPRPSPEVLQTRIETSVDVMLTALARDIAPPPAASAGITHSCRNRVN
ncbi:hypothetical protein [Chromatium okenii]|uniref:hypothetical protein n=1 Tax=Chromatium okenii TaxID=61644 RepID=UPI001904205E|nr:hypothetical protein [Chromatium okenii]